MSDIVRDTFEKWTAGLQRRDAMIKVFTNIRDIPYAVIPEIRSRTEGPKGILKWGRGSCTPKHYLMGTMFEMLGLKVKYVSFPYSWNQPNVVYPRDLKELAEKIPIEYHLACRVLVGEEWVLVDATWDPPLEQVGFPVNDSWDGESNTGVGVSYLYEVDHATAEERDKYVEQQKVPWTERDKLRTAKFIVGLNKWLDELRESGT